MDVKSVPISIRVPTSLLLKLRKIANEEGVPYQTYIKSVLHKHVTTRKEIKNLEIYIDMH